MSLYPPRPGGVGPSGGVGGGAGVGNQVGGARLEVARHTVAPHNVRLVLFVVSSIRGETLHVESGLHYELRP